MRDKDVVEKALIEMVARALMIAGLRYDPLLVSRNLVASMQKIHIYERAGCAVSMAMETGLVLCEVVPGRDSDLVLRAKNMAAYCDRPLSIEEFGSCLLQGSIVVAV